MFNHGITASLLFCFVAFLEDRSNGARGLEDFGGLRKVAPVFCGLMGIALFSSLGLPGLNGFIGEFLIFRASSRSCRGRRCWRCRVCSSLPSSS
jgi:NADH-quinone oxidoreductase subunit M